MTDRPSMLGGYPVEREIGRGGMGVVYLARDPKLDRAVAIKVLPDEFARDPERLARFEREAKLLASLNHPNIASIYGIEEAAGHRLLVLEYIPGDTLAARTERGPLPIDEALDLCRQIALAVEAAHEGGVIHRDLKPNNVKVTPDGQVKVLDFGLAKGGTATASGSGPDLTQSPTITYAATGAGIILGTAAYMSPEQARGRVVDKRTDIWSFGCVLYECLTGRLIFGGDTVSDTIARILEREPDWSALPAQTPATVRELLRRCLEKDVRKRQRDIGDVRLELEAAIAARSTATRLAAASSEARSRGALSPRMLAITAVALVLGAAAGIGLWSAFGPGARGPVGGGRPLRLSIAVPPAIRTTYAGITPDGQTLILLGYPKKPDGTEDPRAQLYTRRLDDEEMKPIPGTEGAQGYAMSPDGRWLAFVASLSEESSQRRLAKVPVDGSSPPVALSDWDPGWGSIAWLGDGDLLIASDNSTKLFRLPSGGGPAKPAIKLDTGPVSGAVSLGSVLPEDRGVFISMESWGSSGYQLDEWLLDPKTGKAHRLFERAGNACYAPGGYVVFSRGEALMAARFDLGRLAVTGEMVALPGSLRTANSWAAGNFEISTDGSLIYAPGGRLGTDRRLVTVDAVGTATPFASERRAFEHIPAVSRDGRKVAAIIPNQKGTYETWVADADRPGLRRALALPNADCSIPVWSPDGQRLAYLREARDKDDGVYVRRADGNGSAQLVIRGSLSDTAVSASSWAPDGSGLLVNRTIGGKTDILFVPIPAGDEPARPRVVRATPDDEAAARFSPNGEMVAFVSDESGKAEVYAATWGRDGTLGTPMLVSSGGGTHPAWTGDSRRLFYYHAPNQVMSVTVTAKPALTVSAPVVVQDLKKLRISPTEWDLMPDGRLIGIQRSEGEDDITHFDIVLGWSRELREQMAKAAGRR